MIGGTTPAEWMPAVSEALGKSEDDSIAIIGEASGVPYFSGGKQVFMAKEEAAQIYHFGTGKTVTVKKSDIDKPVAELYAAYDELF